MSATAADIDENGADSGVVWACVAGAFIAYAGLIAMGMARNGWLFEYPLDDVYIHLAMAEQIARGGYGVNAGEYASAASSPAYPLLLTPFSESPFQRWLPLLWNVVALGMAAVLLGYAFARAGLGRTGVALAAIAPFALSMHVTAFTGMENMAHGAASLAIVLGLWRFVETDRIGGLLLAGCLLAAAFRLEGLALGMAAGGVVAILGRPRAGAMLIALAILPAALFTGYLVALGLDPLPNSVMAKLDDTGGGSPLETFRINTNTCGGRYIFALTGIVALVGAVAFLRDRRRGWFALAVAASGFAHLIFGATGWMDRYENYLILSLVAALALVLGGASPLGGRIAVAVALAGGLVTYAPSTLSIYAWNPKAIAAQQGQMARFAKDFVDGPVAVNDIGYVAWRNPHYVLDLWGLASADALTLRTSLAGQGWAGPLAAEKGVSVAMVYDKWLSEAVPDDWHRLGSLHLDVPNAFLGGSEVAFYATDATAVPGLQASLRAWAEGLPERARFDFAGGQE